MVCTIYHRILDDNKNIYCPLLIEYFIHESLRFLPSSRDNILRFFLGGGFVFSFVIIKVWMECVLHSEFNSGSKPLTPCIPAEPRALLESHSGVHHWSLCLGVLVPRFTGEGVLMSRFTEPSGHAQEK